MEISVIEDFVGTLQMGRDDSSATLSQKETGLIQKIRRPHLNTIREVSDHQHSCKEIGLSSREWAV
jgi:hypothetical protein